MESKFNEATENRPDGDRIIDAPFVYIDTENYAKQLTDEEGYAKNDRNGITVFKSEGHTVVLTAFHADAVLPEKEIKGTVTYQVLEGLINLNLGGTDTILRKGNLAVLHEGILHSIKVKDDSLVLITTNLR